MKVVVITQHTRLQDLLRRHNTLAQARFYVEHMGLDFADYTSEDDTYRAALECVLRGLDGIAERVQTLDRALLPNFVFGPDDSVVTVGRDGLVVNAAKYVGGRPLVAVNPDPRRWDGVLLGFGPADAWRGVRALQAGRALLRELVMAEVRTSDGQRLLACNDFFVGQRSHVSARYCLHWRGAREEQSSSGVIVSTGAGSSGWLSSAQNMAAAVGGLLLGNAAPELPRLSLRWDEPRLAFVVREPFRSRSSGVTLAAGLVESGDALELESRMPEGGVIFSDGMEQDGLEFGCGSVATIRVAPERARLVTAA